MIKRIWRLVAIVLTFVFILGCAPFKTDRHDPKRLPDEWMGDYGYHSEE